MKTIRTIISLALVLGMLAFPGFAKESSKALAASSLIITPTPSILTAGMAAELVDPARPFQLMVTDQNGKPVDLTRGVDGSTIDQKVVWNQLFLDPHPDNTYYYGRNAVLPSYYWTRTDLHNDDGTNVCNKLLFGRNLIEIDFSQASRGIYIFKGFVANDVGELRIKVITPDRRFAGEARIAVKTPVVTYKITNTEDTESKAFESPGDPDFVMTACDNRIYNIRVTVQDAEGRVVRGISQGVSLCTGIKKTARFTPFTTRPANYKWVTKPTLVQGYNFYAGGQAYFLSDDGGRYDMHLGLDLNNDGRLEWTNKEIFSFGPQYVFDTANKIWTGYLTYYNTTNVRYNNGEYSTHPFFDLPPAEYGGWGLGCIYNSQHFDGMIFANLNDDKVIDYRDSLNLDVNGQTSLYIFAEDACFIGGLVGNNYWADIDAAGKPPNTNTSASFVTSRYKGDGVYWLDFDAIPETLAKIAPPKFKLLIAETREDLPKYFFNKDNYDLVYSTQNHVVVITQPADERDLPMHVEGEPGFKGNQHEAAIYGRTEYEERYNDVETTMVFTPTGTGEAVVEMRYKTQNRSWLEVLPNSPQYYELQEVMWLDVYKGLEIVIEWESQPEVGKTIKAFVTCYTSGTQEVVPNVNITVKGCGFDATAVTNTKGKATIECTFTQEGEIVVQATKNGFRDTLMTYRIAKDKQPPILNIDPLPELTKEEKVNVMGTTEPDCVVFVNGTRAVVDSTGKFLATVTLQNGVNKIIITTKDPSGNETEKMVVVEMDNIPPLVILDNLDKLIDVESVEIKGRVEPGSRVRIGEVEATVVNDIFKATVQVKKGQNNLVLVAMDKAGNSTEKPITLTVWHETVVEMVIGNPTMLIDGQTSNPPLSVAPYIKSSRTMVPIRAISQAFGARVEWLPEDKSITITLNEGGASIFIIMRVGSKTAYVDQKAIELDTEPEIKSGTTFVPLRFVAENMGCTVNFDSATKTVRIERLSY